MAKIPLGDIDRYDDQSTVEKFKKKQSDPKKKHSKTDKKHHKNVDIN